jgi:segregation and condensation protein A
VLLHLIKQAEMNIFDLPIADITAHYLDFLRTQQALQLDVAGEYLVMAANLLRIKSHDLLPVEQDNEVDVLVEEVDPREELMLQLLTYRQFQQAADTLKVREQSQQQSFSRLPQLPPQQPITPLAPGLGLVDLQTAFAQILARHRRQKPLNRRVINDRYTLQDAMHHLHEQLEQVTAEQPVAFADLFVDVAPQRDVLVMHFLAILELAKTGQILLEQREQTLFLIKGGK